MPKRNKTASGNYRFSGQEVVQMFTLRAGGSTLHEIVDELGGSPSTVGRILRDDHPGYHKAVSLVPEQFRKEVGKINASHESLSEGLKKSYRKKRKKKSSRSERVSRAEVLSNFTTEVLRFEEAREACRKIGLSDETLDMMYDQIVGSRERSE